MTANVVVTIAPLLLYKNCISFPFKVQGTDILHQVENDLRFSNRGNLPVKTSLRTASLV